LPDPEPLPLTARPVPWRRPSAVSETGAAADSILIALSYHQQTKHHLDRYARSLGYLDWATQPDPFRTFKGAMQVELPLAADGLNTPYADLFTPMAVPARPLDLKSIAILFELALGLSAWKEFKGNRWALRCNPSSGNLHPTEGYAILPALPHVEAGVYHYVSRDHCLERRCFLEEGAAAALGWSAFLLDPFSDDDVAAMLGLNRAADFAGVDRHDREHPDALILVSRGPVSAPPRALPVETIRAGHWAGQANQLSLSHVDWEMIDDVAEATWKPATDLHGRAEHTPLPPLSSACRTSAATLIRQRRSCLALDGQTAMPADTFYRMLDHLLPRPAVPPWDTLSWSPQLHAGIVVHRVAGLAPGLYMLERDRAIHDRLRAALRPTFLWEQPADCPEHLRLYCLVQGDLRRTARIVSCQQEIASDGVFGLGMIVDVTQTIRDKGAWWYRRLFWEAGVLGQVLYLEAEAAGVRSTGIGCYFDDAFHELLGLTGDEFQDLYHFTVGGPVEDHRLVTLPPYAHLRRTTTVLPHCSEVT